MAENNYTPVEDGWKNQVKPCYVEVKEDFFNENSLIVSLSFDFGEGMERPNAKLPLIYAADHKIVEWKDGVKNERTATLADQRSAYSFLMALFPAWSDYCKGNHTTEEKLNWFENEGRDAVLGTAMDIQVKHSSKGYPNAYVKDPTHVKPKKEKVTKAAAIQRAADMFNQMFGTSVTAGTPEADDSNIPF